MNKKICMKNAEAAGCAEEERLRALKCSYSRAVSDRDKQRAAFFAREIRNILLRRSDADMLRDRAGLDVSSPAGFASSVPKIFIGEWARYRQSLRDIPQGEGFPFNIELPKRPDGGDSNG